MTLALAMKRGQAPVLRLQRMTSGDAEAEANTELGRFTAASPELATNATAAPTANLASSPMSFNEVYHQHVEFVWRCVKRLGVPEDCAEDVTQEVFVVVHRKLDSFEGRSALTTWLYGIALGVVRNFRRTRKRKRWDKHEGLEAVNDQASSDVGPEREAARSQAVETLQQILKQLSDSHREVFVLAELEKCTGEQIARITDTKLSTVYARLNRAREEFEKLVSARKGGPVQ